MRYYPGKNDYDEVESMQPEDWMLDLLKMNPEYCSWGPGDDYMAGEGWSSSLEFNNWNEFEFELDSFNEVVNFYFEVDKESKNCEVCKMSGWHPDAQWVTESFSKENSPFCKLSEEKALDKLTKSLGMGDGYSAISSTYPSEKVINKYGDNFKEFCEKLRDGSGYWKDSLTKEDYEALEKEGRKHDASDPFSIDCISRMILCKSRCQRMGIPCDCYECDGKGYIYTSEKCHVDIILWILHPRKGASRGVRIKNIEQHQLPDVFKYLREAKDRNTERFSRIPENYDKSEIVCEIV